MSLMSIFDISGSAMSAQTLRLNTTASNMANVDSASSSAEGTYRARYPVFSAIQSRFQQLVFSGNSSLRARHAGVQILGIVEGNKPLQPRYEPEHPLANEDGYVFYPNVNIVEEMTNMISSSRSFQANVEVMNAAKTMMQRVLTLGQ